MARLVSTRAGDDFIALSPCTVANLTTYDRENKTHNKGEKH
jgi:hypothetical protein